MRRGIVIKRNPMKPREWCIVLLAIRYRGGQIMQHAYTAGIGYATRDEAVMAFESCKWMG